MPGVWLRTSFVAPAKMPSAPMPLAIDMSSAGKGHIWLNGFDCGKFWQRGGTAGGIQRYYQLPQDHIKAAPAPNVLVIFDELGVQGIAHLRVVKSAVAPW